MFTGGAKTDFDARWKNFHIVKSALQDKVKGGIYMQKQKQRQIRPGRKHKRLVFWLCVSYCPDVFL